MKQFFFKLIYNSSINPILRKINKVLYPLLPSKIKLPPSGTMKIQNNLGDQLKIYTNQTNYLTQLLYWEGYENFEYTDIFISLIKKINTFYDIGANIGYYSLLAEMENKSIKVVGFEPATGPLHYFKENVRINNYKNIKIESIALSHKEGEIIFHEIKNKKYSYLEHNLAGESNAGSNTEGRNFVQNTVKTTTLDNYANSNLDKSIDLIKMDTEGTEHFILEHAHHVLKEHKPIVICETLFNTIEPELEKIMSNHGYEFYNHYDNGLKQTKSIIREQDNGVRNCFFVHPEKKDLINEYLFH
ncbi:MAG: FkbM family methyltransferase [Flavobacteriales bacterium]|nr:FkbM family methyltransferase [Flavobacteriales bacterium]